MTFESGIPSVTLHGTLRDWERLVGKARALDFSFALTCAGVSEGCTESIRATVPDTSGAEKLVPSDASKASV